MKRALAILIGALLGLMAKASRDLDRMPPFDARLLVSFNRGDASDQSYAKRSPTVSGATLGSRIATFDGVNDQITYSSTADLNNLPLTVVFWVDMQGFDQTQYASLIDKYPTGTANGWQVWVDTSERIRAWYFGVSVSNAIYGGGDGLLFSPSGYKSAGWTHVAVVFASTGGTIYINGSSVDTQGWTGTPTNATTTHRVALGMNNFSGGVFFKGALDNVGVFNRAWTAAEIAANFASGRP